MFTCQESNSFSSLTHQQEPYGCALCKLASYREKNTTYCDTMVDYSMEDEKWNERKDTLREWHEANPEHEVVLDIANGLFGIGDDNPENRKKYWAAIRSLYAHIGPMPLNPRRTLPVEVEAGLNGYIEQINAAYTEFYDNYGWMLGLTLRPHRKTGRLAYNEGWEYAEDQCRKARHFLVSAYRAWERVDNTAYRWDGTFTEGCPEIDFPVDHSDEGV